MDSKRNKSSEIIRLLAEVSHEPTLTCVLPPLVAPRLSVLCSRENYLVIMDMPSCTDLAAQLKESAQALGFFSLSFRLASSFSCSIQALEEKRK
jgi:hypothetical protein